MPNRRYGRRIKVMYRKYAMEKSIKYKGRDKCL
jgi:hypothetical protein